VRGKLQHFLVQQAKVGHAKMQQAKVRQPKCGLENFPQCALKLKCGLYGVLVADEKVESSFETDGQRVILADFVKLCKFAVLEVGLGAATSTPPSSVASYSNELPPCELDDSSSDSSESTICCFAADRDSRCRASNLLLC
jgi:hypothetical protein